MLGIVLVPSEILLSSRVVPLPRDAPQGLGIRVCLKRSQALGASLLEVIATALPWCAWMS